MKGTLWVLATEASGDVLGQNILRQLKKSAPNLSFTGIGGPLMEKEGAFQSRIPFTDLGHMGMLSVIKNLPFLYRSLRATVKSIQKEKPLGLLTIDGPDFCLRVSKKIRFIPRMHCVAPSVWAWRPWRARSLPKKTDHLLCLFPFESPYFSAMPHTFVGHPVLAQPKGNRLFFGTNARVIALLPGSRRREIETCLPIFLETFLNLKTRFPELKAVILTTSTLYAYVKNQVPESIFVLDNEEQKRDALASSCLALAACGSVSLEIAHQAVPMILGYRVSNLEAWIARHLITLPYVSLINIVAQSAIVPEFLQNNFTVEKLTAQAGSFLNDPQQGYLQIHACQEALKSLWACEHFSQKSTQTVLTMLHAASPSL